MIFTLGLSDCIEDEWFRCKSGVDEVVENMHSSLQRHGKYLCAEVGILIELKVHPLSDVVLTDALKALRVESYRS